MPSLTIAGVVVACIVGAWAAQRWVRRREARQIKRARLRAEAVIWGLSVEPGESLDSLQRRVWAAEQASRSGDPLVTASRALAAQRRKLDDASGPTPGPDDGSEKAA